MLQNHSLIIEAVNIATPQKILDSEEIINILDADKEYFQESYKKFGIFKRFVSNDDEKFEDIAFKACFELLNKQNISVEDISVLIVVTQTSTSRLPNSGHLLQNLLNLPESCAIFDLNDGCNGYINGLVLIDKYLKTNEKGLLVSGDLMSKHTSNSDISNQLLMGDAISATLVTKSNSICGHSMIKNDGSGADSIRLSEKNKELYFEMDGFKVFSFTMGKIPKFIKAFIENLNESIDDYDHIVLHQANKILLENIKKKLKIPDEKMLTSLENYGNTGPASIPVTLSTSKIEGGSKILLVGFGAGLSWGAISINKFNGSSLNFPG